MQPKIHLAATARADVKKSPFPEPASAGFWQLGAGLNCHYLQIRFLHATENSRHGGHNDQCRPDRLFESWAFDGIIPRADA
jgi:hypothetical protein